MQGVVTHAALNAKVGASQHLSIPVSETTSALGADVRRMLLREFKGSKYNLGEVNDCIKHATSCTTVSTSHVTLNYVHQSDKGADALDVPVTLLKHAVQRVQCMRSICNADKPLTFWLVPCLALKEFPAPGKHVGVEHVNSAYTYANGDTVFIFRREEFPKVMLHEAIHHVCTIDTAMDWTQDQLGRLFEMFRVDQTTVLRPNEAIVEAMAELFHTAFIAQEYGFDAQMLHMREVKWSLQQAKRVLARQGSGLWREDTHAFSYYVLRSILVFNPDEFLTLCNIGDVRIRIEKLLNFMSTVYTSKDYIKAMRAVRLPKHTAFRMTLFGDM
jgi:hypothetical protein